MNRSWSLAAISLATLLLPRVGLAQEKLGGYALDTFEPAPAGDALFGVPDVGAEGHLVPRASLMFDYAHEPLRLGTGDSIVGTQAFLHVGASLALWDRLQLSLNMPVAVIQSGDNPVHDGVTLVSPSGVQAGDLRAGARVRLLGQVDGPIQAGVGGYVYVPTAPAGSLAGEGAVRGQPQIQIGGKVHGTVGLAWNAATGLMLRGSDNPMSLTFGGGFGVLLANEHLQIGPEIDGSTRFSKDAPLSTGAVPIASPDTVNLEARLGAKVRIGSVVLGAGFGPGLTRALGTPTYRALGMVAWSPKFDSKEREVDGDTDEDDILDSEDACPKEKGPRSSDPQKNGCPLPDRDEDGVADRDDACPEDPGEPSLDPKKNGCPVGRVADDTDEDGFADPVDACPLVRGVRSDDPAKNGCPAEVVKVVEDPDTDGDGFVDSKDACPKEKGVAHANPTRNGCPREVRVTPKELVIVSQVQFKFGKAGISQTVDPISDGLLREVRDTIEEHPEISKIEVQGHSDDVGDANYNMQLSVARANAVRDWLIHKGKVKASKLVARGYGATRPLLPNTTEENRQANRRVQFVIIQSTK